MPQALILVRRRTLLPSHPTGMTNQYASSRASRPICTPWLTGSRPAESKRWRWNQPACTGSPSTSCWRSVASKCFLVNARHVKNVSGRKSDVLECQRLQQLHAYGLLQGSFRPCEAVCELRSLSRQREILLRGQARCAQHMQKALTQMNIQLANVISDVVGESGQRIIRAIVAGERVWQSCKRVIRHTSGRVNAIRHVGQVTHETGRRSSPSHSIPSATLSLATTFVSGIKRSWLHESGGNHLDSLHLTQELSETRRTGRIDERLMPAAHPIPMCKIHRGRSADN